MDIQPQPVPAAGHGLWLDVKGVGIARLGRRQHQSGSSRFGLACPDARRPGLLESYPAHGESRDEFALAGMQMRLR